MSGVEDNVENYQTDLISCSAVMVSSPMESFFFSFCHSYLDLPHDFHAQLCFHSHFFHCAYFSWLYKCLIGRLFDRKPDKLLSRTLYGIRVTVQYAKKMP